MEVAAALKQPKLHFRFHNLNPVEDSAEYIAKILTEANREKLERLLQAAAGCPKEEAQKEAAVS